MLFDASYCYKVIDFIEDDTLAEVATFVERAFPQLINIYTSYGENPIPRLFAQRDIDALQKVFRVVDTGERFSGYLTTSPLRHAIITCNSARVDQMLFEGAAIDDDILKFAAASGKYDILRMLLNESSDRGNPVDINRDLSPAGAMLNIAAYSWNTSTVAELIDLKAELEHKNSIGDTPLLCAARHFRWSRSSWRIIQCLLEAGANPYARSNDGSGLLSFFCELLPTDLPEDPIERLLCLILKNGIYLIDWKCVYPISYIKDLLPHFQPQRGPKSMPLAIDYCTYASHRTPLLWAALAGETELALDLLKAGADPHARDSNGTTLVMAATQKCYTPLLYEVLESGTDINAQDVNGNTALMLAAQRDVFYSPHLLLALLKHGASPSMRNKEGLNALECALIQARDVAANEDFSDHGCTRCAIELIRIMLPWDTVLFSRAIELLRNSTLTLQESDAQADTSIWGALFESMNS